MFLESVRGDMVVLAWMFPRAAFWLLDRDGIDWCDSCAAADHPMIDHIWRERRLVGRLSIAIGGGLRRALFGQLVRAELGRNPTGIDRQTG